MNRLYSRTIIFLFMLIANPLIGKQIFIKPPAKKQNKSSLFQPTTISFEQGAIQTNPYAILKAAQYALSYFKSNKKEDLHLIKSELLEKKIISSKETEETLQFIINTIKEDHKKKNKHFRIKDSTFLKNNFSFIKWNGDYKEAKKHKVFISQQPKPGNLRLTSYAVFYHKGSYYKTKEFPYALYSIKSRSFMRKMRHWYTKPAILKGTLEQPWLKKHISPLVWLSRQGLEDSLLHGTTIINMPDGRQRIFNVHANNGIPFDRTLKTGWTQKLYWYFLEIEDLEKMPPNSRQKVILHGDVIFAGDLDNLGLGKIIAIRYKNPITKKTVVKLGVLADKGSAFVNNFYQLDLFAGIFENYPKFKAYLKTLPDSATGSVEAYILKKKS